ncbi:MAG: Uma2 family endonuclease [Vicinamibacteria bacterium]
MTAAIQSPPEQRVVLHNLSWQTYDRLLEEAAGCSSLRLTYDRGTLEIMSPSEEHEELNRSLAFLIEALVTELDLESRSLGSATFRREDLDRGFEADSCFYIQSAPRVAGKQKIDLRIDPPPDLVIEVELTSSAVDKLDIYAHLRAPELWRCSRGGGANSQARFRPVRGILVEPGLPVSHRREAFRAPPSGAERSPLPVGSVAA